MKKNSICVLFILILVCICVFILSNRTLSIYILPTYMYAKRYSKLPKISDIEKVVLSFSTDNVNKYMINSILDQSVKVNNIVAVVSGTDEIKDYLSLVAVVVPAGIKGTISPVVVNLIREKSCDTIFIVLLNTKKVYPVNYLEKIYKKHRDNLDTLLYNDDFILASPNMFGCILDEDTDYDLRWLLDNVKAFKKIDIE